MIRVIAGWLRTRPTLGRWALKTIPDWPRTLQVDHIGPFRVRIRRHRSYWLRHPLALETRMLGFLQRLVRPGDCVHDVGANIGLYSRFLAQVFQAGQVIAYEPMRENIRMLRDNLALHPMSHQKVRVVDIALSDTDGEEPLQVDDIMSASAALDRVTGGQPSDGHAHYGMKARTEMVKVARLDTLVQQGIVPPPQVIKIDVEGAEPLVLRGAEQTLRAHRPRIALEFHRVGITRQCLALLDEFGYFVYGYLRTDGQEKYQRVHPGNLDGRTDDYDLHHCVASADERDITAPIQEFVPPGGAQA